MRTTHVTFSGRIRAAVVAGGTSLVLAAATLAGTALAADQTAQTAAAVEKIGLHTHQLHGTVDATPASGASSFVVDTERFGKVTVTFATTSTHGNGHVRGKARSSEVASAATLKAGERVIVQGRTSADGTTFNARRVHVLPEKSAARASHLVRTSLRWSLVLSGATRPVSRSCTSDFSMLGIATCSSEWPGASTPRTS